jgi:hypothetical protein
MKMMIIMIIMMIVMIMIDDVAISRTWESIKENIKASLAESLGYYELKQHKP